jgi:MFS family permease
MAMVLSAKSPSIIILCLLATYGTVCAILLTPALPAIAAHFALLQYQVERLISLYMIGFALGQLLYGPIANRFGRKVAIYAGLSLSLLGVGIILLSLAAESFALMTVGRVVMALGASVGLNISYTLAIEAYPKPHVGKTIACIIAAIAVVPGAAVAIGGLLTEYCGWQSCFIFLAIYGLFIMALCRRIPETLLDKDHHAMRLPMIARRYGAVVGNKEFVILTCLQSISPVILYLLASLLPFIAMGNLHLTPALFGAWSILPPVGTIIGSKLSVRLTRSSVHCVHLGLMLVTLGVGILVAAFLFQLISVWTVFMPVMVMNIGIAILFSHASLMSLAAISDKANASAMRTFISLGIATLCVLLVGEIPVSAVHILPVSLIIIVSLAWGLCLMLRQQMAGESVLKVVTR